jgi:ribosomal protein L7/L12
MDSLSDVLNEGFLLTGEVEGLLNDLIRDVESTTDALHTKGEVEGLLNDLIRDVESTTDALHTKGYERDRINREMGEIRAKLLKAYQQRFCYEIVLYKAEGNHSFPKIDLIKLYRSAMDCSLNEAKDVVEFHMQYSL